MLRIPHCLDSRLTDGTKVVSPMLAPHFTPQKHYYFYVSGTHFCFRYRTRDLPSDSVTGASTTTSISSNSSNIVL
jgi:hypothetical protein